MRTSQYKVLFIVNASLGELHVALPLLKYIKEHEARLKTYVLFISNKIQKQVEADEIYYSILKDLTVIIERKNLFSFLWNEAASIKMILKEYGLVQQNSIIACIKRLCVNAKLVLYPHAFALYDYEIKPPAESIQSEKIYDENIVDFLLITSAYDYNNFSKRISASRISNIGALGYTNWWKKQLTQYSNTAEVDKIKNAPHKRKILFTLRGTHKIYLDHADFELLLQTALEQLFKIDDVLIIIKPHPRQDMKLVYEFLSKFPRNNWVITNVNTFTLSALSDFTLSFWSSAITDSLAVGTPTIEYHIFRNNFTQTLYNEKGEIVSFYTKLKFAIRASTPGELSQAIDSLLNNYDTVKEEQLANFNNVFSDRFKSKELFGEFLSEKVLTDTIKQETPKTLPRFFDWIRLMVWGIKNR